MVNNSHIKSTSYLFRSVFRLTFIEIDCNMKMLETETNENNIIFNLTNSMDFQKDLETYIGIEFAFCIVQKPVNEVPFGWLDLFTTRKCTSSFNDRCF